MTKVVVAYEHDSTDLATIEMAVSLLDPPAESEWQPVLRDIINGRRAIWIRSEDRGEVWIRDREGARKARRI